jgi:cell division protein FtsL
MTNRFYPDKQIRNTQVARPVSSRIFVWLTVIALAGALLSCGFVISARQHFATISTGYENEELRRQAAQLEEKRRQLELEYARLASPVEIERRAQKAGLSQPQSQPQSQPTNIRRPTNAEAKPKR